MTRGASVLHALELYGEAHLLKLMIREIFALLIRADPQGTNPKPKTKKGRFGARPRALYSQSCPATPCFSVNNNKFPRRPSRCTYSRPSPLPPRPYFPLFEDPYGDSRPSIGSFESPGEAKAPTAHVGPDAV